MTRSLRYWHPGTIYHVMCRGNRKSEIFKDETDNRVYLKILMNVKNKYDFELHCYCLMVNHVHLLIETHDVPIGTIMKQIDMTYSIYFNHRYKLVGHLFQDRYKSEVIYDDRYLLTASKYIHLNPVKSNIAKDPQEYEWSSYSAYTGKTENELVSTERILSYFEGNKFAYQFFVWGSDPLPKKVMGSDPQ